MKHKKNIKKKPPHSETTDWELPNDPGCWEPLPAGIWEIPEWQPFDWETVNWEIPEWQPIDWDTVEWDTPEWEPIDWQPDEWKP